MVCLGRPYRFKFFKRCILQILFGQFLNTLTHMVLNPCKSEFISFGKTNENKVITYHEIQLKKNLLLGNCLVLQLLLFVRGKLGTSKTDYGDTLSNMLCLLKFSSGK